jgi:hypothetical protein
MPECQECGAHVTQDFVRVFGVEGKVYGCTECKSQSSTREFAGLDEVKDIRG